MLPQPLLHVSARVEGDRIVPRYFTAEDEPWLRVLMDEYARFVGRKRGELEQRLREPLPTRAPKAKLKIAAAVLDSLTRERTTAVVPPKEARAAVFREASLTQAARSTVLSSVAASLGVTSLGLEEALFADLRSERRVAALPASLSPSRLATDANLWIVTSLIRRAAHVKIAVWGNSWALVRHARLMGLICALSRTDPGARSSSGEASHALFVSREEAPNGVVLDVLGSARPVSPHRGVRPCLGLADPKNGLVQ